MHAKDLRHNKTLYANYGLKRWNLLSLSSKHFEKLPETSHKPSGDTEWDEQGFITLSSFIDQDLINEINLKIEEALTNKVLDFNYTGKKILFAYEKVPAIKKIIKDERLTSKLNELVGGEVMPFQSINFMYGSEQKAHSDSIHMSTYPTGGLIAIWVALDDITTDNGPLFYYPGSHKLPYVTNKDMGANTGSFLSPNPNKLYEEHVANLIKKNGLKPVVYEAKKGDVLIWHANLLHGGMPHINKELTRKSLVVHYFKKDAICYHEISQRPAIIKPI